METPMLSSLMGWNHETTWRVPSPKLAGGGGGGGGGEVVEVAMSEKNFIVDHVLDGKILYPATGYLYMAWEAYAKSIGLSVAQAPVVLKDVHIHNATVMSINGKCQILMIECHCFMNCYNTDLTFPCHRSMYLQVTLPLPFLCRPARGDLRFARKMN